MGAEQFALDEARLGVCERGARQRRGYGRPRRRPAGRAAGAAALDVTEPEPLPAGHPLRQCPNAFITPHIAGLGFGHRPEVTDYITGLFTQNLRLFLAGKPLKNEVDMALGYTKKGTGLQ